MPHNLANAILILILLIVAVVSWQWLEDRDADETTGPSTIAMAENETDYTLEDFVITNVNNTKGQVYQLSGKSLSHFVNGSDSIIDSPSVNISGDRNQRWSGSAKVGYLSPDFTQLKLSGDVALAHLKGDSEPVNVSTEVIDINTQSRQMQAPQPVDIKGEHWSFAANQMQADLDNGILTFQSGVEAKYAVPE